MAINLVEDVGAPALVTAVDLLTQEYQPTWNEYAAYILAGSGYIASFMGVGGRFLGGNFLKNVGIAALPLAARHIYTRVKGTIPARVGSASRMAFQSSGIRRYPAPPNETPFAGVKLT